jgi:hypothetical protein
MGPVSFDTCLEGDTPDGLRRPAQLRRGRALVQHRPLAFSVDMRFYATSPADPRSSSASAGGRPCWCSRWGRDQVVRSLQDDSSHLHHAYDRTPGGPLCRIRSFRTYDVPHAPRYPLDFFEDFASSDDTFVVHDDNYPVFASHAAVGEGGLPSRCGWRGGHSAGDNVVIWSENRTSG